MEESLQQMTSSMQSNQALQASALVGRKVLVNNNKFTLGAEGDTKISIDLPAQVDNLTASIYSESGELIKTIPLGQPELGTYQFSWDDTKQDNERAAAGKYKVEVREFYKGKEVSLKTMTSANVDSVSLGQNGEGLKLHIAGVGSVTLDQIKQITN